MQKPVIIIVIVFLSVLALAGAGYLFLPVIIEKETTSIRADVQDLSQRLQRMEAFVQSEEEARKVSGLKADADVPSIVRAVKALAARTAALEDSLKKDVMKLEDSIKRQDSKMDEGFKAQAAALNQEKRETQAVTQKVLFNTIMANIRGHILKAKIELAVRNAGVAKNELDLIDELFTQAASVLPAEKDRIVELQASLRKAKTEIDANLPAAINRIDLLWHEIGKMIRKA